MSPVTEPDYFTLEQFRLLPDMANSQKYPDPLILAAAEYITAIVEREVGVSFIGRTVTESYDGGGNAIILRTPHVLSVTSATVSGDAVTDELRAQGGILGRYGTGGYNPSYWAPGTNNVIVTYVAGYSATPPADIREAVMQGTRARLLETASTASMDDRRTSLNTDAGTVNFVIAGEDRPTGYPSVDAVILGWKRKLDVYGFA